MTNKLLNPVFIRSLRSKNSCLTKICSNSSRNYSMAKALEVLDLDCLPNPSNPWLMLPPEGQFDKFYSPADNQLVRINREKSLGVPSTARCVASTRGWLGYVDGQGICPVYLSDPFKGQEINVVSLPPLSTLSCFIDPIPVSESEFEDGAEYHRTVWGVEPKDLVESPLHHSEWGRCHPKVMAESPFLSQLTLSHPDLRSPDCKVIAQQRHFNDKYPDLCYFPIGKNMNNHTQDFKWFGPPELDYDMGIKWLDWQFVFSSLSNLFYATHYTFCSNLQAVCIHDKCIEISPYAFDEFDSLSGDADDFLENLDGPEMLKSMRKNCFRDHYIVALENGDLLVVFRYYTDASLISKRWESDTGRTLHFDVFRHDLKNKGLKLLDSLDGHSLFIGPSQSFCGEFLGMLPDSIYFSVQQLYYGRRYSDCSVGIFNMNDNSVRPCYPLADATFTYPENAFWVAPRA